MSSPTSPIARLKAWCAHAFAVAPAEDAVSAEEEALANRLAAFVVRRRMAAPALMLLESGRPLNFLGGQVLAFLSPFLTLIFPPDDYGRFVRFLEKRQSVDCIVDSILAAETRRDG